MRNSGIRKAPDPAPRAAPTHGGLQSTPRRRVRRNPLGHQGWTSIRPVLRGYKTFYLTAPEMQAHLLRLAAYRALPMESIEVRTFRQSLERNHQLACSSMFPAFWPS